MLHDAVDGSDVTFPEDGAPPNYLQQALDFSARTLDRLDVLARHMPVESEAPKGWLSRIEARWRRRS